MADAWYHPAMSCRETPPRGRRGWLVGNAVKYMGDQGEPRVEVGAELTGDTVLCHVRDNGAGIEPRHLESVFGLFRQLDARDAGSGVGLALVERIVKVHGGRVWGESAGKGEGSTFYFTLPQP